MKSSLCRTVWVSQGQMPILCRLTKAGCGVAREYWLSLERAGSSSVEVSSAWWE